jgi:tRNA threonylcarbamoyl adenosine modification protein YjeE
MIQNGNNSLALSGLEASARLGALIAGHLQSGAAVLLRGDLGAGKTTLARAILTALGHTGEVPSPTFTLMQAYALPRLHVTHCDLYRLQTPEEIFELGFDDALARGAVLVEWPEQAEAFMPAERLEVCLQAEPRMAAVTGTGCWQAAARSITGALS